MAEENEYIKAVIDGDMLKLKTFLDEHIHYINKELKDGRTLLILAIQESKHEIAEYLLQRGAKVTVAWKQETVNHFSPDMASYQMIYPIQIAVNCQLEWAVLLLLRYGAYPDQCNCRAESMLEWAVKLNWVKVVKQLIQSPQEEGFDAIRSKDTSYSPSLLIAISQRNIEMVILLLKLGADVNIVHDEKVPLTIAANLQDYNMCVCLIANGAFVPSSEQSNGYLPNPVAFAIQTGLSDAVEFLLDKFNANPNCLVTWNNMVNCRHVLESGCRLIHLAVAKRNLKVLQSLIKHNANISATDNERNNILHIACQDRHIPEQILKYIIDSDTCDKSGAYKFINSKNQPGITPLMLACRHGTVSAVKLLIEKGIDLNVYNKIGRTALYHAVKSDNEEITLMLLRANADVDMGKGKSIPLQMAVHMGSEVLAGILMDFDADVTKVNPNNLLYLAVESKNRYLVELFLGCGLNINARAVTGDTVLMLAARSITDKGEICKLLIAQGANMDLEDKNQKDVAVTMAVYGGYTHNASVLISQGANINIKDQGGPLHWSVYYNYVQTIQLLLIAGARLTLSDMISYPKTLKSMRNGELTRWMVDYVTSVDKLRLLCVRSIRRQLQQLNKGLGIGSKVHKLPIPEPLKEAVLLEDIELHDFLDTEECLLEKMQLSQILAPST